MFVCICNAISDKDINQALENGANTPADVYRYCNCSLQCGSCLQTIKNMIPNEKSKLNTKNIIESFQSLKIITSKV